MKLRELLKEDIDFGIKTKFIICQYILVGAFSGKTRYDSDKDDEKVLDKYLDSYVFKIKTNDTFTEIGHYALTIYIDDYDLTKEENKEKQK